jgi:hypothetical protein
MIITINNYLNPFYLPQAFGNKVSYGWISSFHLSEKIATTDSSVIKIFAKVIDKIIGPLIYNSAAFLYNNSFLKLNNRHIDKLLNQNTTKWNQQALKTWSIIISTGIFVSGVYYYRKKMQLINLSDPANLPVIPEKLKPYFFSFAILFSCSTLSIFVLKKFFNRESNGKKCFKDKVFTNIPSKKFDHFVILNLGSGKTAASLQNTYADISSDCHILHYDKNPEVKGNFSCDYDSIEAKNACSSLTNRSLLYIVGHGIGTLDVLSTLDENRSLHLVNDLIPYLLKNSSTLSSNLDPKMKLTIVLSVCQSSAKKENSPAAQLSTELAKKNVSNRVIGVNGNLSRQYNVTSDYREFVTKFTGSPRTIFSCNASSNPIIKMQNCDNLDWHKNLPEE